MCQTRSQAIQFYYSLLSDSECRTAVGWISTVMLYLFLPCEWRYRRPLCTGIKCVNSVSLHECHCERDSQYDTKLFNHWIKLHTSCININDLEWRHFWYPKVLKLITMTLSEQNSCATSNAKRSALYKSSSRPTWRCYQSKLIIFVYDCQILSNVMIISFVISIR